MTESSFYGVLTALAIGVIINWVVLYVLMRSAVRTGSVQASRTIRAELDATDAENARITAYRARTKDGK